MSKITCETFLNGIFAVFSGFRFMRTDGITFRFYDTPHFAAVEVMTLVAIR